MSASSVANKTTTAAEAFVEMLPRLRRRLWQAFTTFRAEQREDALQETLANCFVTLVRLWERNCAHLAAPGPLARYAIARWFDGRRVGSPMNSGDVATAYGRRRHGTGVLSLGDCEDVVLEACLVDGRSPVPEQAAFRIDFPRWLRQLSPRNRLVTLALGRGESTLDVARRYHLSSGRVSQLRSELRESWAEFHGEYEANTRGFRC